jgi:hypothetical protein
MSLEQFPPSLQKTENPQLVWGFLFLIVIGWSKPNLSSVNRQIDGKKSCHFLAGHLPATSVTHNSIGWLYILQKFFNPFFSSTKILEIHFWMTAFYSTGAALATIFSKFSKIFDTESFPDSWIILLINLFNQPCIQISDFVSLTADIANLSNLFLRNGSAWQMHFDPKLTSTYLQ